MSFITTYYSVETLSSVNMTMNVFIRALNPQPVCLASSLRKRHCHHRLPLLLHRRLRVCHHHHHHHRHHHHLRHHRILILMSLLISNHRHYRLYLPCICLQMRGLIILKLYYPYHHHHHHHHLQLRH